MSVVCPKCGSGSLATSLVGYLPLAGRCQDGNYVQCGRCDHRLKGNAFSIFGSYFQRVKTEDGRVETRHFNLAPIEGKTFAEQWADLEKEKVPNLYQEKFLPLF
jgi:hypothetical protein